MGQDEPKVIVFQNPIDPEAAPITAQAQISMSETANGGLKHPLHLPSPSLVFRVPDTEPVLGYTARIEASDGINRLTPGSTVQQQVVFIGVPTAEVWVGRVFALWHGRDVGTARIIGITAD